MPKHRNRTPARLWLAFTLLLLCGAHYLFFRFSFHELNPFPVTRGLSFGSGLWSLALLLAMTFGKGWARYVLITWLTLAMLAFGLTVLMMNSRSIAPLPEPTNAAMLGLVLCALALGVLSFSRALRQFGAPRTAGGL